MVAGEGVFQQLAVSLSIWLPGRRIKVQALRTHWSQHPVSAPPVDRQKETSIELRCNHSHHFALPLARDVVRDLPSHQDRQYETIVRLCIVNHSQLLALPQSPEGGTLQQTPRDVLSLFVVGD